jgi:hypothetical protein
MSGKAIRVRSSALPIGLKCAGYVERLNASTSKRGLLDTTLIQPGRHWGSRDLY